MIKQLVHWNKQKKVIKNKKKFKNLKIQTKVKMIFLNLNILFNNLLIWNKAKLKKDLNLLILITINLKILLFKIRKNF